MQIVTGRRGEPHVTSRQMQAVYRSFLGDFALLDIGEKLRAEAYSDDIVRVYDGVVSVQGIYAVIAYNQYDEVYIEPVSVGKKRIDTIVLHYTKDNTLDVEDMQLDVVQGEEYTDNPIAPVVPEGGDAWEGTTDIQVPIYDIEVTNFGLTVTPYARMLTVIPTLDSIAERIPETVVTGVKGDSEVLYRDGDVNITKANIGLGNVDNTADTDKPISTATQTALAGKVDKVAGKGLSTEDYTTTDKTKLAGISEGATQTIANPADTATETLSKIEVGGVVYDIPQGASGATELSELTDVNLTDVEDNDILQYDETANKWKNSNALQGAKTTSGNPLTITDAAPVNAVNLSMDLEPIQDLHGYDHPWVGGAGKNKLQVTAQTTTSYGVTFTVNSDGTIDLSGTPVGLSQLTVSDTNYTIIDTSKTYILSGLEETSNVVWNTSTIFDANGNILKNYPTSGSNAITFDDFLNYPTAKFFSVSIKRYKNDTPCTGTAKIMLRESTETDPTFESYSNICHISGRKEEVITQKDNLTNPTVTKTYTIQIGQTVYGCHHDVTKGKMVVDRAEKDLGDLDWRYVSGIFYANVEQGTSFMSNAICSAYENAGTGIEPANGQFGYGGTYIQAGYRAIRINDTRYTDATTFKTAVTGQQLVYELATPFTIDLTPTQIKLLENTNTISTDYEGDTITLEYQPNNAIGEAVRAVEESYDPEFAVRPVLKKKAFSGTTDSDGSVTLINASDIPSGHKIIPLQITDMTIDGNAGTYFVEYEPYNSGDAVKGYCYFYMSGSQMFPVGKAITGNFYYYELEV